mmetsp:Transcript_66874/g.211637  ORF Transcript_66874/g.211637 Transcript_66874/m.211637 type:complete len:320 (-) Transcript_66874:405-1364(-)
MPSLRLRSSMTLVTPTTFSTVMMPQVVLTRTWETPPPTVAASAPSASLAALAALAASSSPACSAASGVMSTAAGGGASASTPASVGVLAASSALWGKKAHLPLALGLLLLEVLPLALRLLRLCRSRALAHGVLAAGSLAGVSSLEGLNDTTAPPPLLPITINHYKYSIKCRVQVPSTNSHRAQRLEDPADPFPSLPISFQPYHRFWLWLPPALLSLWCAGLTSSALRARRVGIRDGGTGLPKRRPPAIRAAEDLQDRLVQRCAASPAATPWSARCLGGNPPRMRAWSGLAVPSLGDARPRAAEGAAVCGLGGAPGGGSQ